MTIMEIIAIIATGVLCVLCVICIVALLSSKRQANENKKAIKDIENSLGTVGNSIKEKTDLLIEQLERQQSEEDNRRRLELLEEEIQQLTGYLEEAAAEQSAGESGEDWSIEEIDDLGDEIELDDLFRELNAMTEQKQEELKAPPEPEPTPTPAPITEPVMPQPAPEPTEVRHETRYHQGYNIGRSGRKYTAEELNVLIRE